MQGFEAVLIADANPPRKPAHFWLRFSYFVKVAVNLRPDTIKEVGETLLPTQTSTAIWGVVTKMVING